MKYICSIYKNRPKTCDEYPWNIANQIFPDCQFYNSKDDSLVKMEVLLESKTEKEVSDFCVSCGKCCFFGPAACSKLLILSDEEGDGQPKST
jgi:Fe-S-cluster containining protein